MTISDPPRERSVSSSELERRLLESAGADGLAPEAVAQAWAKFSSSLAAVRAGSVVVKSSAALGAGSGRAGLRFSAGKYLVIGAMAGSALTFIWFGLRRPRFDRGPASVVHAPPREPGAELAPSAGTRSQAVGVEPRSAPVSSWRARSFGVQSHGAGLDRGPSANNVAVNAAAENGARANGAAAKTTTAANGAAARMAAAAVSAKHDSPASIDSTPLSDDSERSSLAAEVAALDAARAASNSGAFVRALELLESYRRDFPNGVLRSDAEVAVIEALYAAGAREEASQRAARFLTYSPNDPHAATVKRFIER